MIKNNLKLKNDQFCCKFEMIKDVKVKTKRSFHPKRWLSSAVEVDSNLSTNLSFNTNNLLSEVEEEEKEKEEEEEW